MKKVKNLETFVANANPLPASVSGSPRPNGNFTFARFATSMQNEIVAEWFDPTTELTYEYTFPVDLTHPFYVKLLDTFTVDEIKKMSDEWHENQLRLWENWLVNKAKQLDIFINYEPEQSKEVDNKFDIKYLVDAQDSIEYMGFVFDLKLELYDKEEIMNSDKQDLLIAMREAKTPLEVMYYAGKILYE